MKPQTTFRQSLAMLARPYIMAELPAWGRVYELAVGGYQKNDLWKDAGVYTVTDKRTGFQLSLDLSNWADRSTFFLGCWYDLAAQLFLEKYISEGDTVVDVGANRGMFSLCASGLVGKTGKVFAFEPNPEAMLVFQQQLSKNQIVNVSARNIGLGCEPGTLTLHVPAINSGEASFGNPGYADQKITEVPVDRGDNQLGGEHVRLIKLDVEGFEVQALQGMEQTIRRCQPILLTEVVRGHLVRCGETPEHLYEMLTSWGYKPKKIDVARSGLKHELKFTDLNLGEAIYDAVWFPERMNSQN